MERLNEKENVELFLYHGKAGVGKFINYESNTNFKHKQLKTWFLRKKEVPCVFSTLFKELKALNPDVIIAEGESNMMNNVIIYIYSLLYNKRIAWWSMGRIPGYKESFFQKMYKPLMMLYLKRASHIIGYSTYTQNYYANFINQNKIVIAHNCLDNEKIDIEIADAIEPAKILKKELGIENKFTILLSELLIPIKALIIY
jgi:hypothetical protein